MAKKRTIKSEIEKLNKIFKDIPEDKRELVDGLIQNAAFMLVTLDDLQEDITNNGAVVACQSGNGFETIKDNPAQKAYTTMIARYANVIAQLNGYLPSTKDSQTAKAGDALMAFIKAGKPE